MILKNGWNKKPRLLQAAEVFKYLKLNVAGGQLKIPPQRAYA